jgi:hypothetical protein
LRVVAQPEAIDAILMPADGEMLRIAPDDAIVVGAVALTVNDPFAIVEHEHAFVHWRLTPAEFAPITDHIEWPLPTPGLLGQGLIAGVPAKIVIGNDHVLLVVSASLAHELAERLW